MAQTNIETHNFNADLETESAKLANSVQSILPKT